MAEQFKLDSIFKHKDKAIARKILDETLLVPIRGDVDQMHHLFVLNSVAAYLWKAVDGNHDISSLTDGVCDIFKVERAQAELDVHHFIGQLLAENLIEPG